MSNMNLLNKNIRYHTDVDLQLAIRYLIAGWGVGGGGC